MGKGCGFRALVDMAQACGFGPVPSAAVHALVTVMEGNVRYRYDGIDPTPTTGYLLEDGQEFLFGPENLHKLRFIECSPGVHMDVLFFESEECRANAKAAATAQTAEKPA